MEMFGQSAGFILYRTSLTGHKKGKLRITELHDYATVFVDGKYIGKLDRAQAENIIELPESQTPYPQLDILVEGMGRYWEIGPQFRLYCPAPWLKTGSNEIIVFDMHLTRPLTITGHQAME